MNDLQRIAVVIDADNTQLSKVESMLREVSARGRIVVRRAYGNWRKDLLKNWESEIKRLAIKAVQQFDYVPGKNATDIALVIDTIDLLHKNIYDAFVIVSSDSDYTPLAIRLQESGVYVIGVGERKTPISFKNSCDEFLLLENMPVTAQTGMARINQTDAKKGDPHVNAASTAVPGDAEHTFADADEPEDIEEIHSLLRSAYDVYQDDDGFANVAAVGSFLKRAKPDFDCRTYGYSKLPQLLEAFPEKYKVKRYPGKGTVIIVAYQCVNE